jgi:hypothetical protein
MVKFGEAPNIFDVLMKYEILDALQENQISASF